MSDKPTRPRHFTPWSRPMVARRSDEPHRTVTPLELFFDLCFVVAVRQTADRLHHNLAETDIAHGIGIYPAVFFAIWWAWMNFTTFASAYDPEDYAVGIGLLQLAWVGRLVLPGGWRLPAFDLPVHHLLTSPRVALLWGRTSGASPSGTRWRCRSPSTCSRSGRCTSAPTTAV